MKIEITSNRNDVVLHDYTKKTKRKIPNNKVVVVLHDKSAYITMNGYVYYIDDSTNEQIMNKWTATELGIPEKERK
tara:strand:+ start:3254 stop:3481 length:228 start_codon:yes stop_codon:yes gene_type:complete